MTGSNVAGAFDASQTGKVPEWLNGQVSKTLGVERLTRVQISPFPQRRYVYYMFIIREHRIARFLRPYISKDMKVLDFGCGTMLVAQHLAMQTGAMISGVDVIDINKSTLPMLRYNGRKLPFADRSYDVTYAAFVFHHIVQSEELIAECMRVTRRTFILLEDIYRNAMELLLLKFLDTSNKLLDWNMSMPFTFQTEREWIKLLGSYSKEPVKSFSVRPNPIRPTRHRMFVVTKV